jgi:hypothetical protein
MDDRGGALINSLRLNLDSRHAEDKDSYSSLLIDDDAESQPEAPTLLFRRPTLPPTYYFFFLQLLLIAIYTTVFFAIPQSSKCVRNSAFAGFAPVQKDLQYHSQLFSKTGHHSSPYAAPPSPATDLAWKRLLTGGNMRISAAELQPYNTTSVPLADGSGYLAKMAFYHELHCLHKIKRWLYPQYYYSHAPDTEMQEEAEHLEHCIEWIRTAALCRADTTLTLFEWVDSRLETKYPIPHKCADAEGLLWWSREQGRDVNIDEPGVIEWP